jgi:hypothetical protein
VAVWNEHATYHVFALCSVGRRVKLSPLWLRAFVLVLVLQCVRLRDEGQE